MHVNENSSAEPSGDDEPVGSTAEARVGGEAVADATAAAVPDVDELEDRLRDLQGAMDHLQTGDLDGAERAIEALEERMESTRD